jgi:NADH:ubiquinone oxidoreductase subunit 6 (subunit J)
MIDIQASLADVHGLIRWFILSLAVVGAARSFVSMLSVSGRYARLDVGLSNAYSLLLDVQGLLGVLLVIAALLIQRPVPWLHAIIMLPAIIVGHLNRRFRHQPDRTRQQIQFGIFLGTLALIALGLAVINQLYLPT